MNPQTNSRKPTAMPADNFQSAYSAAEPKRSEVDAMRGVAVLEFGAPWCPICQRAQPSIQSALQEFPDIKHIKIEDGSGRPLGRSFRVKLWPTLVVLKNGTEIARVVRPNDAAAIQEAVAKSA
jgi:thioredoxin 1